MARLRIEAHLNCRGWNRDWPDLSSRMVEQHRSVPMERSNLVFKGWLCEFRVTSVSPQGQRFTSICGARKPLDVLSIVMEHEDVPA